MNGLQEKTEVLVTPERCDRCSAKAKFMGSKQELILCFCNHHKNIFEPNLIAQGWAINNI